MKASFFFTLFFMLAAFIHGQNTPGNDGMNQPDREMSAAQKLVAEFPSILEINSPLNQRVDVLRKQWQAAGDPRCKQLDYAYLLHRAAAAEIQWEKEHESAWNEVGEKFAGELAKPDNESELLQIVAELRKKWGDTAPILKNPRWPVELYEASQSEQEIRQKQTQAAFEKLWAANLEEMFLKYPEAAILDSPLRNTILEVQGLWLKVQDARLYTAEAPLLIAQEAFLRLKQQEAAQITEQQRLQHNARMSAIRVESDAKIAELQRQHSERLAQTNRTDNASPQPISPSARGTTVHYYTDEQRVRIFGSNATDEQGNTYHIRRGAPGTGNMDIEGLLEIRGNTGFGTDGTMYRKRVDSSGRVWFEP